MITGKTHITGVVGHNIRYTYSPVIHNFWYHHYKIDGVYVCFDTTMEQFSLCVQGLFAAGIKGLNVTVPFKEIAYQMADIRTLAAEIAGAANCLYLDENNRLVGDNTDGYGFSQALLILTDNFKQKAQSVLLIGAGGASSGIIPHLLKLGLKIYLYNRSYHKAEKLVSFFNHPLLQATDKPVEADLIVQTTPIKADINGTVLALPEYVIHSARYVVDINYGRYQNHFLQQFKNIPVCDGTEMLLQQAAPAFSTFNRMHYPEINQELRDLVFNYNS